MSTVLRDRLQSALTGRYVIERELGRGGMATVYLARDTRHDRLVALKVLHPDLAAALGSERFLAEIRTTANLQHPHILPLHDSGEADGQLFYVMPFVAGETLRARLERERHLPVGDAVRVAREVASALDYAHRQGVIHRDIKPENILLHDGSALVADFGIALAVQTAGGSRMTQTGLSLGTPQYMSPEQAMGERSIDARSDVYSLGAVLYEMLTGDPPFTGSSVQAIVAKVMTERPTRPRVTRDTVPSHVDEAVMTALAKIPADRFATAASLALALQADSTATTSLNVSGHGDAVPSKRGRRLGIAAAWSVAAAAVLFAVARELRPTETPQLAPVVRTHLELAPGEQVLTGYSLVLSPLGDRLAYVSQGPAGVRTYVRRSDELTSREIVVGSPNDYAFSPDGRWLAYDAGKVLMKVSSDGGPSVTVGTFPTNIETLAWRSPDEVVAGTSKGLWLISAAGGSPQRVLTVDSTTLATSVNVLEDGETVIFMADGESRKGSRLTVVSVFSGKSVDLGLGDIRPRGVLNGHLIYTAADGALMAVPFDARGRKLNGAPVQLMERAAGVAISASGTIAYAPPQGTGQLVMVGGGGADVPVMSEIRRYASPRFSPDGRRIAVAVATASSPVNQGDIWVYDITARTFTQVSTDGPMNAVPEWSPDGSRVLYRRQGANGERRIWWRPIDGSGPAEQLKSSRHGINEALISPDGKWLVYRTTPGGSSSRDILAAPMIGDRSATLNLVVGPASAMMPRLSPDGRWLAYVSDESGRAEIYVQPFPQPGARIQVTTDGGSEPLWARSGKALVYRAGQSVISVAISMTPRFTIGERRTLATGNYLIEATHPDYDISPDASRLLMIKPTGSSGNPVIVHNWGREMAEKLATERR